MLECSEYNNTQSFPPHSPSAFAHMANPDNPKSGRTHLAAEAPELLLRSRVEIARFLRSIADGETPLTACPEKCGQLFMARLRHVDPGDQFIVVDFSENKAANTAVLASKNISFSCSQGLAYVEFTGNNPSATVFEQTMAIRFDLPRMLLAHHRRLHPRIGILPEVPLRCIADSGGITPFEAKITDISRGGFGALIYDNRINLEPGTVLKGCKIVHPRGTVANLDIEVSYSVDITLPDGTAIRRSGFKFIGSPSEIDDLAKVFVINLDGQSQSILSKAR